MAVWDSTIQANETRVAWTDLIFIRSVQAIGYADDLLIAGKSLANVQAASQAMDRGMEIIPSIKQNI